MTNDHEHQGQRQPFQLHCGLVDSERNVVHGPQQFGDGKSGNNALPVKNLATSRRQFLSKRIDMNHLLAQTQMPEPLGQGAHDLAESASSRISHPAIGL